MSKNQKNSELFNSFQIIGTCQTELISCIDSHGKENDTLEIKTDGEYPVIVRVHFYNSKIEKNISYKGQRVKVRGTLQGKIYYDPKRNISREWLQLRGSSILFINKNSDEFDEIEQVVITEDDLPFAV